MRVALYGGSFDPPHRGHLAVARAAAQAFALDTVLFTPTGLQPLKPHGPSANFADRLAMVELLCASASAPAARFEPSTLEQPDASGQPNFAIDTLRKLHQQHPEADLFAISGADSFLDLRRWREPDALLEAAEWIVVSRPGFSLRDLDSLSLTPAQRQRVHLLDGVAVPVSATEIRHRLRAEEDCSDLLTPEVLHYIREHHLYAAS
jgi:nicotinate-nucleotide adenylyltransferase